MGPLKQIKLKQKTYSLDDLESDNPLVLPVESAHSKIMIGERHHHVLWETLDPINHIVKMKIDGRTYVVQLENELDLQIAKMGYSKKKHSGHTSITAPMPGQVLQIRVSKGDLVSAGDELITLEAMKMENVVTSKEGGSVKAIHVAMNESVVKGQLLIEIE